IRPQPASAANKIDRGRCPSHLRAVVLELQPAVSNHRRARPGCDHRRRDPEQAGIAKVMITLGHYLIVSGMLFTIGFAGVMLRRNIIVILMALELMLNAANLSLVAFSRF